MASENPFLEALPTRHTRGDFSREEVALANRNSGIALETLRYDLTPVGLHYLLIHFDIPHLEADTFRLSVGGLVARPLSLSLDDLRALPRRTERVTLECAGNGRGQVEPRYQSMPWSYEAVGTAEWTGTPLANVLTAAGLDERAAEIVFYGADRGFDRHGEHTYGRSLAPAHALRDEVLLVYEMNGMPLLPQHGFPLRLVVPGWFGMASVKWLERIEVWDRPFDGPQQTPHYHFRTVAGEPGTPVTTLRVKSLMVPPGLPDVYTRRRVVERGDVEIVGRAWSGAGAAIARVEVAVDGVWREANLDAPMGRFAWRGWKFHWRAEAGLHELACRATDIDGNVQPLDPVWDVGGFGNNAVQRVQVMVR
ncbi:MAG: sulfite oxidase [Hyphomicrobiaceae bacterium]|nr:sulfite oxidase [Hyphomicrobiaceae bacterium]